MNSVGKESALSAVDQNFFLNPQTISPLSNPRVYTSEELYNSIRIDSLYFQATNGGVTFGGGEPLLYPLFIQEIIERAPNWSYWIETSLNIPYSGIQLLKSSIDKFVVDIKSGDNDIYSSYTGVCSGTVKDNLIKLIQEVGSEKVIVRVPNIPNYTTPRSVSDTICWLHSIGVGRIDCFTYSV